MLCAQMLVKLLCQLYHWFNKTYHQTNKTTLASYFLDLEQRFNLTTHNYRILVVISNAGQFLVL